MVPEDVKYVWADAIAHRLVLPAGAAGGVHLATAIAGEVLNTTRAPRLR